MRNSSTKNKVSTGRDHDTRVTEKTRLVATSVLPEDVKRYLFPNIKSFNEVQSTMYSHIMDSDNSIAVSAPTGCGKTAIMELAIARLVIRSRQTKIPLSPCSVVYIAPMKSLCAEKFSDWSQKLGPIGLTVSEVTGDTSESEVSNNLNSNVLVTTPEKWDHVTRSMDRSFFDNIKLYLIDEIHMLSDLTRGPTMEVLIARTKAANQFSKMSHTRFITVSATCPNISDIAQWLGTPDMPALSYHFDSSYRPVPLELIVLGYPYNGKNPFQFDFKLNYRLNEVIQKYSDGKPTLVFCSTRKGSVQSAKIVSGSCRYIKNSLHSERVRLLCNNLHSIELREMVYNGVGYHHAGLHADDRRNIEAMFLQGHLPVLFSTSTLSVGVNLPAHLVIIKSTDCYQNGVLTTAPISQIIQMIGRAGRPQFDTQAKAVVMVKNHEKERLQKSLLGQQPIESCLHLNFLEHLNFEINMRTINCQESALRWMKSTFLYVRLLAEPKNYCLKIEAGSTASVNQFLIDILEKNFVALERLQLVKKVHSVSETCDENDYDLTILPLGSIMAYNNINFKTMESFLSVAASESIHQLLQRLCSSDNIDSVVLRVEEKKQLNDLKNRIPYKLNIVKVKTAVDKICILAHATLVSLTVPEFTFQHDINQIFRLFPRLGSALVQILEYKKFYLSLKNAHLLLQSIRTRMWHNSKFVSKQIPKIGQSSAELLVSGGYCSFQSILEANPRHIELVLSRHAPFGNTVINYVRHIPRVSLQVSETLSGELSIISVILKLDNLSDIKESSQSSAWHKFMVIIGTNKNELIFNGRVTESFLKSKGLWSRSFATSSDSSVFVSVISSTWCGVGAMASLKKQDFVDIASYSNPFISQITSDPIKKSKKDSSGTPQECKHTCKDKKNCAHPCCKVGIVSQILSLPKSLDGATLSAGSGKTTVPESSIPTPDSKEAMVESVSTKNEVCHETLFAAPLSQVPGQVAGTPAKKFTFKKKDIVSGCFPPYERFSPPDDHVSLNSLTSEITCTTPVKRKVVEKDSSTISQALPASDNLIKETEKGLQLDSSLPDVLSPSKRLCKETYGDIATVLCNDSDFNLQSTNHVAETPDYFSALQTEQSEAFDCSEDDGISYSPLVEQDTSMMASSSCWNQNKDEDPSCSNFDFDDDDDELLSCVIASSEEFESGQCELSSLPAKNRNSEDCITKPTVPKKQEVNPLRILFPNSKFVKDAKDGSDQSVINDPDSFLEQFKYNRNYSNKNQITTASSQSRNSSSALRNYVMSISKISSSRQGKEEDLRKAIEESDYMKAYREYLDGTL